MRQLQQNDNTGKAVLIIVGSVVGVLLHIVLACGGATFLLFHRLGAAVAPAMQNLVPLEVQQADGVVQMFLNDMAAGQVDMAYNSTTAAFRARQPLAQFKAFITQHPLLTKYTGVQLNPANHVAGAQRMSLQYTLTGDGVISVTFQLVNQQGQWLVDGLTVP